MNSIYRTWNWDVHQGNHYVDTLSQVDETLSSFKRPQMRYSNVLKPSVRILSFHSILDGGETDDTIPLRHTNTSKCSKARKRKSGRRTENEGEDFQTDDQLLTRQHIFVCQVFIFHSDFFFFPKIWKHGLAIERLGKGFCFIMHWNYFRMVKGRLFFLFFFFFKQQHV